MGRTRFRRPCKTVARQQRTTAYRVLGVSAAALLSAGLLSVLIAPAAAKTAAPHILLALPRSPAQPWTHALLLLRSHRSTRRAPFLSWTTNKSFSTATIVHTYKVTTTADSAPAACPATTSEPCTLRQAINQANADGTLDKVQVPAAPSPYLLGAGQLIVTDAGGVVLAGGGQAKTFVQADTASSIYPFRVLQISNGSAVQISNMTIEDGHSSTLSEDGNGGGIELVSGSLTMRNSTVTANTADTEGGGIYVAGKNSIKNEPSGDESQAYLKNTTISGNTAFAGGGGLDVEGQAIIGGGSVTGNALRSARFPGPDGAGIRLGDDGTFYPSLSAADLDVTANSGAGDGGGILNAGSLRLSGGAIGGPSLADGNEANEGGGLDNAQVAMLDDVSVKHNRAASFGGGIYDTDRLSMTGGTLSANRAAIGGGLEDEQQAKLTNVMVAGNKAIKSAGGLGLSGSSLSVNGGSIVGNSAPEGAGVSNTLGTTTIAGTSIIKNTATFDGGGIFSRSPLTLTRVHLGTTSRPNVAADGGGLYTVNTGATVVRSTIEGNQARNAGSGSGGGIFNTANADIELDRTTLTGNSSDHAGGAITNFGATMTITASTLSGNQVIPGAAQAFGGGISNKFDPADGPATLTMINDTVTGNRAGGGTTAGFGGGIENDNAGASLALTNVTVSRNRAGSSGSGGGIYNNGVAALRGTILSGNTAASAQANCGLPVALTSNGYNLSNDNTCGLTGIGDQTGVNPMLGPLANNGGPTQTVALKSGSPAVDAVEFCPPPKTDQRGVKRQGPCDVGAYERVPDK